MRVQLIGSNKYPSFKDKDIVYLKYFLNVYNPTIKGNASTGVDRDYTIAAEFTPGKASTIKTYPLWSALKANFYTTSGELKQGWLLESKSDWVKGSTGSLLVTCGNGTQKRYTTDCGITYNPGKDSFTALAK